DDPLFRIDDWSTRCGASDVSMEQRSDIGRKLAVRMIEQAPSSRCNKQASGAAMLSSCLP
ncbi:MAG: hypothetical protein RQ751_14685, partial [Longimicrobiales bacterium]|nr:hypothetical protein [Longimicrobiales bacterium]